MKRIKLPSSKYLNECFSVDHDTGDVYWKDRPASHFDGDVCRQNEFNKTHSGTLVRTVMNGQYKSITLNGNRLLLHRIIYRIVNKRIPKIVDHINGNKLDNRPCNLRGFDKSYLNFQNTTMRQKVGLPKGVRINKDGQYEALFVYSYGSPVTVIGVYDDAIAAFERHVEAQVCVFGKDLFCAGHKPESGIREWNAVLKKYGIKPNWEGK